MHCRLVSMRKCTAGITSALFSFRRFSSSKTHVAEPFCSKPKRKIQTVAVNPGSPNTLTSYDAAARTSARECVVFLTTSSSNLVNIPENSNSPTMFAIGHHPNTDPTYPPTRTASKIYYPRSLRRISIGSDGLVV